MTDRLYKADHSPTVILPSETGEDRCTIDRWCPAMLEALNPGTGDGKGLTRNVGGWLGADPKDAPPRNFGVTYRKHARTQGFVLIACPWCRSDIRFWMTEEGRLRDVLSLGDQANEVAIDIVRWFDEYKKERDYVGHAESVLMTELAHRAAKILSTIVAGKKEGSVRPNPCCVSFALTGKHWHGCPEVKP